MFGRVVLIVLVATFLGWSLLTRSVDGAGRAQVYVVQPGDTLWSIASARYAGDPREGIWKLQAEPPCRDDDQPRPAPDAALIRPDEAG